MKRILLILISLVLLTPTPTTAEDFLLYIGQSIYVNNKRVVFSRGTTQDEPHLCILQVEHDNGYVPMYVKEYTNIHFEGLLFGIRDCTPDTIELSIEKQLAHTSR